MTRAYYAFKNICSQPDVVVSRVIAATNIGLGLIDGAGNPFRGPCRRQVGLPGILKGAVEQEGAGGRGLHRNGAMSFAVCVVQAVQTNRLPSDSSRCRHREKKTPRKNVEHFRTVERFEFRRKSIREQVHYKGCRSRVPKFCLQAVAKKSCYYRLVSLGTVGVRKNQPWPCHYETVNFSKNFKNRMQTISYCLIKLNDLRFSDLSLSSESDRTENYFVVK